MKKRIKTHCNDCQLNTNQEIIFSKKTLSTYFGDNDNSKDKTYETHMVIRCLGCRSISFVHRVTGKNFCDEEKDRNYIEFTYPEKQETNFEFLHLDEQQKLPKLLSMLYEEIEIAFEWDANILAGIGLRMLVEGICLEQKILGENLKQKIERLFDEGLIAKKHIPILDKLREIGNITTHQIRSFPTKKLRYALEIINHVLKSIYILPLFQKKLKL